MLNFKTTVALIAAATLGALAAPAFAQDPASSAQPASGAQHASGAKPTREQKRAERKARRAAKNAQLKQLEDQGFKPGGTRIDEPLTVPATPAAPANGGTTNK